MRSWAPAKWDPNLKHIELGACQKGRNAKARGLLLDSPFSSGFQLDIQAIPHTKWEFLITTASPSNSRVHLPRRRQIRAQLPPPLCFIWLLTSCKAGWGTWECQDRGQLEAQLFLVSVATLVPKRWTPAILPLQRVFRNKYHFKRQNRPKSWLQSPQVILAQWS